MDTAWIKMPLGTKASLVPGVLDGDTAPLKKGAQQPPHFKAHVCCGQMAGWIKMTFDTTLC